MPTNCARRARDTVIVQCATVRVVALPTWWKTNGHLETSQRSRVQDSRLTNGRSTEATEPSGNLHLGSPGGGSSRPPAGVCDRTQGAPLLPKSEKCSRAGAAVLLPAGRSTVLIHPRSKRAEADARGGEEGLAAPASGRAGEAIELPRRARATCWSAGAAACFLVSGSDAPVFPSHANQESASAIVGPAVVDASWTQPLFFLKKLLHVFCNLSFKALKKQQEHSFK
jgi:hypothetical protein